MTTIQSRYGQDIHHSKGDGKESCHTPEETPIPSIRENLADGDEATHALIGPSLGVKDELDLFPIITEFLEGL